MFLPISGCQTGNPLPGSVTSLLSPVATIQILQPSQLFNAKYRTLATKSLYLRKREKHPHLHPVSPHTVLQRTQINVAESKSY